MPCRRKNLRDRANEERTTLKGAETVLHARTTLVLYHRDGATVAQLEKDRPLVIGRACAVGCRDSGSRVVAPARAVHVERSGHLARRSRQHERHEEERRAHHVDADRADRRDQHRSGDGEDPHHLVDRSGAARLRRSRSVRRDAGRRDRSRAHVPALARADARQSGEREGSRQHVGEPAADAVAAGRSRRHLWTGGGVGRAAGGDAREPCARSRPSSRAASRGWRATS